VILRKIVKILATRCQILRLKCTKFEFGWGSAQTLLGEPQLDLRGLRLREGRKGRKGREGGEKKKKEGERREER